MINETLRKDINVDKVNILPIFNLKEGDDALLKLALFKNSVEFDITGQTVRLGAKTKNGLLEQIDGFTISKNNLDIKLKNSILVPGTIEIDLAIKDSNGIMTTASFFIIVNQKVLNDEAVKATNEFDTFTRIEENYNNFKNEVNSSLDNIENEIEELKQSGGGGGGDIDLSDYATKEELNTKADITTISSHTSNTTSHITSAERSSWNNKSNFNGDYNSLTNKPTIPTTTSQLTNNSGFITSIPNEYVTESELSAKGYLTEHQDISGKANISDLTSHTGNTTVHITASERTSWNNKSTLTIGTSSTTAYRGDYGNTAYTHSQTAHAPSNAQKNSDITKSEIEAKLVGDVTSHTHSQYLTTHQDLSNYPKTSELTLGVHTDGLIYLFKGGQPVGNGVAQTVQSGDVVGYVDSNNNIVLNGKLAEGTYKLQYEMEDGSKINVGQIDLSNKPAYTNQIPLSVASDGTPFNGGQGWKTGYRLSTSGGGETVLDGTECTGFIPVTNNSTIRIKGIALPSNPTDGNFAVVGYDKNFTKLSGNGVALGSIVDTTDDNGISTFKPFSHFTHFSNSELAYIRVCSSHIDENSILTVDEPIV